MILLQPARIWLSSANACEYAEQLAHWQMQLAGIVTVNGAIFHGSLHSAVKQISDEGYKNIGFAHFNYINPMPKNTEEILSKYKKII